MAASKALFALVFVPAVTFGWASAQACHVVGFDPTTQEQLCETTSDGSGFNNQEAAARNRVAFLVGLADASRAAKNRVDFEVSLANQSANHTGNHFHIRRR